MATEPSYWTWKRRSRARVEQQLESIQSEFYVLDEDGATDEYRASDAAGAIEGFPNGVEEIDLMSEEYLLFNSDSDCDSESDTETKIHDLEDKLTTWALEENITHSALNKLLQILKCHHPSLPLDARTLLKTTRTEVMAVQEKAGGTYHYFGIFQSMASTLQVYRSTLTSGMCLKLQVNVDGLPLFKSSSTQFWPILGYVQNLPNHKPFVIALFAGNKKPKLNEYMEDFVKDINNLEKGFFFNDVPLSLKLEAMVCDAPARAFLKCVKGHTGYSGCEKCTQEGEYLNNRVVFPIIDAPLRQDEDFIEMTDEVHHLGASPLLNTSLGLVSGFPLDFLHLVCLGVMRRLVYLWLKGPLSCRLSSGQVDMLSEQLQKVRQYTPVEFNRRPRTLKEIDRWKASEFRQLLLYTGPVLLKPFLHAAVYKHFLLFFVGIFILSSKKLFSTYTDYANNALVLFVQHFRKLYGDTYVSYNVHNLVHLAQDAKVHGTLDCFSAFRFENYMKTLKKMVRKPQSPCSQVVKRILERGTTPVPRVEALGLRREHVNGPLPAMFPAAVQYSVYKTEQFTLKLDRANCYVSIQGKVAKIRNIISNNKDIYLLYSTFDQQSSFFEYPISSTVFGVYLVDSLSDFTQLCNVGQVEEKLSVIPHGQQFVAIPLLHVL